MKTPETADHAPHDRDLEASVESSLRTAAAQIEALLGSLNPGALKTELEEDVTKYTRLVNALAKLSEAGLKRELQRVRLLERKTRQHDARDGQPGGITPETLRRIQEELELL